MGKIRLAQFPVTTSVGKLVNVSVTAKSARNFLITIIKDRQLFIYEPAECSQEIRIGTSLQECC